MAFSCDIIWLRDKYHDKVFRLSRTTGNWEYPIYFCKVRIQGTFIICVPWSDFIYDVFLSYNFIFQPLYSALNLKHLCNLRYKMFSSKNLHLFLERSASPLLIWLSPSMYVIWNQTIAVIYLVFDTSMSETCVRDTVF